MSMWKCFFRGVRETLERGLRVIRPSDRTIKNDCPENTNYCRNFTPCFLNTVTKYVCIDSKGPKGSKNGSTAHEPDSTILNASSAFALGWVLSQPCYWRKWWNERNQNENYKKLNLIHLLGKVAKTQPVNVGIHSDSTLSIKDTDSYDVVDSVTYGPKTAEEVLNEAVEEFRAVHDSVTASSENKRGVHYVSLKRHHEAVNMFLSASKKGYAPAAYNLAQCYETGLGIEQDFTKAAKWYKVAADKGHAIAKYNLGVFYAHGWGGLNACNKTARKLFEEAAEKGQPDAKAALGLSDKKKKPPPMLEGFGASEEWHSGKENTSDIIEQDVKENDANDLYKMALAYEPYVCDDVSSTQIILRLHKMASDMGHIEAKARYQLLEAYEAIGILQEFLCGKKTESKIFKGISPVFVA